MFIDPFRIGHFGLAVVGLLGFAAAEAQIAAPPPLSPDKVNGVGFGVSYGEQNDRNADFWGWSAEYSRVVHPRWVLAASIAWDEETERTVDSPDKVVRSFTATGTVSYLLTERFTLTTGLAKGIANTDNSSRSMKFAGGDLNTGIAIGYGLPAFPAESPYSLGISLAYEYNISAKETAVSMDLTIGFSF